jgi:hypothetical protein
VEHRADAVTGVAARFPMTSLDEVLEKCPSDLTVRRSGSSAVFQRGGMEAVARELENGLVEVIYEHAPHETTREKVPPSVAARLIELVFQRRALCHVDAPPIEWLEERNPE